MAVTRRSDIWGVFRDDILIGLQGHGWGNAQVTPLTAGMADMGCGQACAIMGDSLGYLSGPLNIDPTNIYMPDGGWFNWLNAYSEGAFRLVKNFSVAGLRSDQVMATQVQAVIDSGITTVLMMGPGTNDVLQGLAPDWAITNNLSILQQLTDAGVFVVVITAPPLGNLTVNDNAKLAKISRAVVEFAATRKNVVAVDAFSIVVDPAAAAMTAKAGYLVSDNVHLAPKSARAIGFAAWQQLSKVMPWKAWHVSSPYDTLAVSGNSANAFINPLMTGVGGSLTAGYTGQVPDALQALRISGTGTGVCSIQARADGFGNDAQMVITAVNGDEHAFVLSGNSFASMVGGKNYVAEVSVSHTGMAGLQSLQLGLIIQASGVTYIGTGLRPTAENVAGYDQTNDTKWVRSPPVVIPSGATVTSCSIVVSAKFGAAGGGTLKLGRASITS